MKRKLKPLPSDKMVHPYLSEELACSAYQQRTTAELMSFHHATLGAPVVKTLVRAINNNWLSTFPGLTADAVKNHLPKSIQTTMGHLHRVRQGIRSTKKLTIKELMESEEEDDVALEKPR